MFLQKFQTALKNDIFTVHLLTMLYGNVKMLYANIDYASL